MDPSQDKPLQRLYEQKADLENARVTAPAEEKARLRQRMEDLDREIAERLQTLANMTNLPNLTIGIAERQERLGDRVRVLVVTANPLGSSPLQLDREVKIIDEALRRSRKRNNFEVEYRLAATPSELRRALLDVEPHVLHFSGHGAGNQGLLFVSDESAGSLYRSPEGEVRTQSDANEIRYVPADPLARLLGLCDEHLECVVLNACYSDIQGNAIAAYIPITIGSRDQIADRVAIKFAQGFYDAIGAGRSYEKAFQWGQVAIEFDLANQEAAKILVLRKKGETTPTPNPSQEGNGATRNRAGETRSLDLGNGVSLTLVYIPGGTFWMGSKDDDPEAYDYEKPRHQVTLPAFWMGETPVTQGQYQAVMGSNPSHFQGDLHRPVELVSWNDADRFCQELSRKLSQEIISLPSESQWEYACRGGTDTRYFFGDDAAQLGNYAWYYGNSGNETHPVKQKKPNAWGLYDMHGNVWEWCADQWHDNYQGAPTDGSAWLSSDESKHRLLRGGSWRSPAENCRSAYRYHLTPADRDYDGGFRVVCRASRTR